MMVQGDTQIFTDGQKALSELILALGHDPALISTAELQTLADRLAALAKHNGWGWRYLRNVINGKQPASRKLAGAILRLGAVVDDTPLELAQSERIEIRAMGRLRPGTIIYGDSQLCANPLCGLYFLPRHSRHRYHSAACRKAAKKRG